MLNPHHVRPQFIYLRLAETIAGNYKTMIVAIVSVYDMVPDNLGHLVHSKTLFVFFAAVELSRGLFDFFGPEGIGVVVPGVPGTPPAHTSGLVSSTPARRRE